MSDAFGERLSCDRREVRATVRTLGPRAEDDDQQVLVVDDEFNEYFSDAQNACRFVDVHRGLQAAPGAQIRHTRK